MRVRISTRERDTVYRRDGGLCYLCGAGIDRSLDSKHPLSYQVDHVEAQSLGGANALNNYRAVHRSCNATKSDTTPTEARSRINRKRGASRDWTSTLVDIVTNQGNGDYHE